jgi:hypothetical protein
MSSSDGPADNSSDIVSMKDTTADKQPEDPNKNDINANTTLDDVSTNSNAITKKRSFEDLSDTRKKRKPNDQESAVEISSVHSGVRLKDLSDAAQEASISSTGDQPLNIQCDQPEMLNYKTPNGPQRVIPRPLPPIVLETRSPKKVPPSLRRLDPNTRVDIFNRKTGKIMSGEDAICIRDLPEALLLHAEYEPIVPPDVQNLSRQQAISQREGRSAPNVRVSRSVTAQARGTPSNYRGKKVRVTKGPYNGYIGKVNKFTPGGWLILSQVRASKNELAFPLVVGPQSIELLSNRAKDKVQKPDSSEKNNDETAVASANIFAENENL